MREAQQTAGSQWQKDEKSPAEAELLPERGSLIR
jgi:hypothetical protein